MSGRTVLSELASKELLARYGIPFALEHNVHSAAAASQAARKVGFPVAVKLCGDNIAHKTERGLVRLRLVDEQGVEKAANELLAMARPEDGEVSLLVAPMIKGERELIAGLIHDVQFGPTIMLGVGGIYTEAMSDVVFRPLPLKPNDPEAMLSELKLRQVFAEFRGLPALRLGDLRSVITGIEATQREHPEIISIDINPLIVGEDGSVVAVDALVEIDQSILHAANRTARSAAIDDQHFAALFNPRGVVVVGASTHPGKFGFVSLHNILASGYSGTVFGTNLNGEEVLGIKTVASIEELPDVGIDLAFICTPASANLDILRDCAAKHIPTVYVTSAGYGEANETGQIAEEQLIAGADKLGLLMIGPNGQGVVSTPAALCAQIVAPYPPRGNIAVASQSGNFVSSFLNYSRQTGVGISRSVSVGNAAQVTVGDFLDFYSRDDETRVALAYIEGVNDGRLLKSQMSSAAQAKPLVVVKGGATDSGARAAASHTGSLASNDAIFDGVCRQTGASRAVTIEEAFDVAATFATQPLPKGPRIIVLTTVGGWGVVTSDALHRDGMLTLIELPDDLADELNTLLPARWSKSNPVDCAGGETRDTIPEILDHLARHPSVDGIIFLGIGVQSNQARLIREGSFYPDFGLERIVSYHERQDERFARAAHRASVMYDKPILTATELAVADPENPAVKAVRQTGRLCYPSGNRAVIALGHLYRYAIFRGVAQ
ncbi:MAG: acetate--CoA ligase family protein [Ilumatobacteraceae bacterium]